MKTARVVTEIRAKPLPVTSVEVGGGVLRLYRPARCYILILGCSVKARHAMYV
jgi:hypothetical protein